MCGIIGLIGDSPNNIKTCLDGLQMLLNRGYDSVGVASINDNNLVVKKNAGDKCYESLLNDMDDFLDSKIMILHSRWATNGIVSVNNAHPHTDHSNKIALVHNGIIENYLELKNELMNEHSIVFKTETDTEVICNLISVYYDYYKDFEVAIDKTLSRLSGTWALLIICKDIPTKLFCVRNGSPMLIGFNDTNKFAMIASEQSGFVNYVQKYICLNNHDVVILENTLKGIMYNQNHNYEYKIPTNNTHSVSPDPFPYWTIKEIYEQYDASNRALNNGGRILSHDMVKLGGLDEKRKDLINTKHLIILGCGTSYNSSLFVSNTFKDFGDFITVTVFDGAEFTSNDVPNDNNSICVIFVSQSGESSDLYRCFKILELQKIKHKIVTMGVINAVDSLIARSVDCGVYLNAGREVAVASTKSFMSQVIVLSLISIWFNQNNVNNNKINERIQLIEGLKTLCNDIKTTISLNVNEAKIVAKLLSEKEHLFVLGKGNCVSIAREGSLKIKEIGYLNSTAYSSSSLKHGPFALIEKETPIIIVSPNDSNLIKNNVCAEEIATRGGYLIGISDDKLNDKYSFVFNIPKNVYFTSLLSVIPLQLIAYELSIIKGNNPDMPRNLAKCVTVE